MPKFAGDKFESQIRREAANAVRGNKVVTGAYDERGHYVLLVNDKVSPSVSYLQQSFGTRKAWEFLTKDCKAAHGVFSGKFIASDIDY